MSTEESVVCLEYRNAFHRIVEGILGHTVHVQSGLRKYYFEFGLLLQQLVQFYHQRAHDVSKPMLIGKQHQSWIIFFKKMVK